MPKFTRQIIELRILCRLMVEQREEAVNLMVKQQGETLELIADKLAELERDLSGFPYTDVTAHFNMVETGVADSDSGENCAVLGKNCTISNINNDCEETIYDDG